MNTGSLAVMTALFTVSLLPACQSTGDGTRTQTRSTSTAPRTAQTQNDVTVPTAKEELKVGKRQVQEGTTKVQKRTVEKPVEEKVQLREEDVVVERRAANRPIKDPERAFEDTTIEMTETKEEPVVAKEARQTGEVVLKKQTQERTETIRDTVRETDVDVVEGAQQEAGTTGFASIEPSARRHYAAHYKNKESYTHYRPAYEYGYRLSQDPQHRTANWSSIESQAERNWDSSQGSWEDHKEAVKYGWEQGRQASRARRG